MNYHGLIQCKIHGVRNRETAVSHACGVCVGKQLFSGSPEQRDSFDDPAPPMTDRHRQCAGRAGEIRVIGRGCCSGGNGVITASGLSEQVVSPSLGVLSNHDPDRPPDP